MQNILSAQSFYLQQATVLENGKKWVHLMINVCLTNVGTHVEIGKHGINSTSRFDFPLPQNVPDINIYLIKNTAVKSLAGKGTFKLHKGFITQRA